MSCAGKLCFYCFFPCLERSSCEVTVFDTWTSSSESSEVDLARCEHEADLTRSRLELKTLQLEIDKRLGAVEDAELHSRLAWHTHAI